MKKKILLGWGAALVAGISAWFIPVNWANENEGLAHIFVAIFVFASTAGILRLFPWLWIVLVDVLLLRALF